MRKYFLLTQIILLSNFLVGQITINNTHMPISGDTLRYSSPQLPTINIATTGANATWDYTSLKANVQGLNAYKSYLQTPYIFYTQFANSIGLKTSDTINLGILTITNVHTFYRNRTTGYTGEGTGFTTSGIPLASDYSDPDMVFKFPLNFNQKDTDNFRVVTSLPTLGSLVQQGTRYNHVDGWGNISTPFIANQPCLRIFSDIREIDSLKTSFINFGFPVNRREIKWLTTTTKMPILEVSGSLLGSVFTPTEVRYRDSFRNIPNNTPLPRLNFSVNKKTGTKNIDTFSITNTTTPNTGVNFQWAVIPNKVIFVRNTNAASRNPRFVSTDTGQYDIKLTATNAGGSKDSTALDAITITGPSNIKIVQNSETIFLMPNPVSSFIAINPINKSETISILIYDMQGKIILKDEFQGNKDLDVSFLTNGRYIIIANNLRAKTSLMFDKY